ncbi:MAG: hypothetical protein RLZZ342_642 [Candidatus Parcubacteria bacterium]|jgi:hypothetical protein
MNQELPTDIDIDKAFAERIALLPPVVQAAIQSADLEKHLRALADSHKLHIDQWELLENEVKLALLGFEDAEKLPENLESVVGVDKQTAGELAQAINDEVFEPIRQELERALTHPEAKEVQTDGIEKARQAALSLARASGEATPAAVQAATPPAQKPEGSVVRAPLSETYKPSVPSSERKAVDGDPYRELPV